MRYLLVKMFYLNTGSGEVSSEIKMILYCFLERANFVLQTLLQRAK